MAKEAVAPRKIVLNQARLQGKEFVAREYFVLPDAGTRPDDMLNPDYWVHCARKLRNNTLITVRSEDGTFAGILIVLAASDTWARCEWLVLREFEDPIEADPTPERDLYKIDNVASGWRVIDKATGKALVIGLPQRADAEKFIDEHIAEKKNRK